MSEYFEGYYYKHQKGDEVLCLIAGSTRKEKFIQVITKDFSIQVPYTQGNFFSSKGVLLNICHPRLTLTGKIRYEQLSPIRYDIMGPFQYFPMECRHGVVSMCHLLKGEVVLNGKKIDFTGGTGYLEMDSGRSFPTSYSWVQANNFHKKYSIMAAVAAIPFCGLHFQGCICVIQYKGREYRLATYLGVRVLLCTAERILLKQGRYVLDIWIRGHQGLGLRAPVNGSMTRTILETASCTGDFYFYDKGRLLFHIISRHTSYEYEEGI